MAQVQDAAFVFSCWSWDYWLQLYDCHSNVSSPWLSNKVQIKGDKSTVDHRDHIFKNMVSVRAGQCKIKCEVKVM